MHPRSVYGWVFVAFVVSTVLAAFVVVRLAFEWRDRNVAARSITYTVNHQRARVYQVAHGDLGHDEFVGTLDRLAGDGEVWHYATVLDLTAATLLPTLTTIEEYLQHRRELEGTYGARGPLAIVADGHVPEADTRAFCQIALSNGLAVGAFPTVQQAERCLDACPPAAGNPL